MRPDGTFGGGALGRMRVDKIVGKDANSAVSFEKGIVITGVTTSTTFSGSGASLTNIPSAQLTGALPALDGSNLTGITQTTINNNANNRVITGSGTANTLEGEANLTFDGTNLKIGNAGTDGVLRIRGAANSTQVSISDNTSATLRIKTASGALGQIFVESGQNLVLGTDNTERLRIDSSGSIMTTGNVNIGRSSNAGEALTVRGPADGDAIRLERAGSYQWFMGQDSGSNLYFKANTTKEITFPAAGGIAFNGETASNNTLNDYEEGSFTPQFEGLSNTPAYAVRNGKYTKVGRLVHITGIMQAGGTNPTFTTTSDILKITGLPYAGTGVMYYVSLGNVSHQGWNCMGSGNNEQNYSSGNIDFMNCQMEHNTSKMLFIAGASGSSRSRIRNASVHNQGFIMMFELSYTAA